MRKKVYLKSIKIIYVSVLIIIFLNLFVLDLDNSLSSKRRRACDKFLNFGSDEQKQFVSLTKNWEQDPKYEDKIAERLTKDGLLEMKRLWEPEPYFDFKNKNITNEDKESYLSDLNEWLASDNVEEKVDKYKNFCHDFRYNFDNVKSFGNLIILLILGFFLVIL